MRVSVVLFYGMNDILFIFIVLFIVGGGVLIAFFLSKRKKEDNHSESIMMLQEQLNHITQLLDNRLSESSKAIQAQFGQSAKIIKEVTEKLT